ncbi:hypothetical protein [Methanobacterium spitsbergense]|uniref:Uncharacterized protein n=1 Tax=Methanobacterium spitsbergense TaxID=2874285 RepID=A0A8T5URK0_9EURY|nr:hypothetical protein [Methanobacterium spitsbergense]MBZ2164596.1 hypothetical protein [Methanobacterium spitsbergense]
MFVDWVLISYMDQSELLLKRSGKFNDNIIIGIEINEKNNLIKVAVDNENIVSYPMANMVSYTYSRLNEEK